MRCRQCLRLRCRQRLRLRCRQRLPRCPCRRRRPCRRLRCRRPSRRRRADRPVTTTGCRQPPREQRASRVASLWRRGGLGLASDHEVDLAAVVRIHLVAGRSERQYLAFGLRIVVHDPKATVATRVGPPEDSIYWAKRARAPGAPDIGALGIERAKTRWSYARAIARRAGKWLIGSRSGGAVWQRFLRPSHPPACRRR